MSLLCALHILCLTYSVVQSKGSSKCKIAVVIVSLLEIFHIVFLCLLFLLAYFLHVSTCVFSSKPLSSSSSLAVVAMAVMVVVVHPQQEPWFPMNRCLGGPHSQFGHSAGQINLLLLLGFQTQTIQPAA